MNAPAGTNMLQADRRRYVGGSDVAAILGISPYVSPVELYLRKRGEAPAQPDDAILRRGRRLEPYVRDMYAEETVRQVQPPVFVIGPEPWIAANLDGTSYDARMSDERVLEIKTANAFTRRDWGEEGTDAIPVYYTAQLQWYLMVTGLTRADLAALIGLDDFRVFTVEADRETQAVLIERAREFWRRVQEGQPPEPQSPEDAAALFPEHTPGAVVEANDVDVAVVSELKHVRATLAEIEQREETLRLALQKRLGEAEALTLDGIPLCTWKTQARRTVDTRALREQHPDIAERFERIGRSRVFRIK